MPFNTNNNFSKECKFLQGTEVMQTLIAQWKVQLNLMYTKSSGSLVNLEMGLLNESMCKETLETINENIKQLISTMKYFNDYFNQSNEIKLFNLENCINNTITLIRPFFNNNKIVVHTTYNRHIQLEGIEPELMHVLLNILNEQMNNLTQNRTLEKKYVLISTCINLNQIVISIQSNSEIKKSKKIKQSTALSTSKEIIKENFNGKIKIYKEEFFIYNKRFCGTNFVITLNK